MSDATQVQVDLLENIEIVGAYPPLVLSKEFYDRINKGGVDEQQNN